MWYVADVSEINFHGYYWEKFSTLQEAFAYAAEEIENGAERIEISTSKNGGSSNNIEIDARDVLFDSE